MAILIFLRFINGVVSWRIQPKALQTSFEAKPERLKKNFILESTGVFKAGFVPSPQAQALRTAVCVVFGRFRKVTAPTEPRKSRANAGYSVDFWSGFRPDSAPSACRLRVRTFMTLCLL
jgi:hypothetical protein